MIVAYQGYTAVGIRSYNAYCLNSGFIKREKPLILKKDHCLLRHFNGKIPVFLTFNLLIGN